MNLIQWLYRFFKPPEQEMTVNTDTKTELNEVSFDFNFTKSNLKMLLNQNPESDEWHELMISILPKYDINTIERVVGFISQTAYESSDYTILEENLNYSASALNRVFPKYFRNSGRDANLYHRKPEQIANIVYANRMGNGDINSGDGWRYRGRGIIQLTGKYNYSQFGEYIGYTIDQVIDYLQTKTGALESACWFWKTNKLNIFADKQDIKGMTRKINGGYHGFDDRKYRYRMAFNILDDMEESTVNLDQTLSIGSRGETVRELQARLSISQDGIYGPATFAAVMKYQNEYLLTADGIADPKTMSHIFNT